MPGALPVHAQEGDYYQPREWAGPNGGSMNISSFVFRDMNESGTYDLGDRVLVDVAVELVTPSGDTKMVRTNIGGYANFNTSLAQADAHITAAGVHTFRVVPPPGWTITTENGEQDIAMSMLVGAPGDIVAAHLPVPVGLAPIPEIRGQQAETQEAVTARGPDGETVPALSGDDGAFRLAVTPGRWTVGQQEVEVDRIPVVLPLEWSDEARLDGEVVTLGFDDLFVGDQLMKVPNGYGGLRWENWVATHGRFYEGEGYINTMMSGEFVAYTSSGHPTAIAGDAPFDFPGGYFGVAWSGAEGETLRIRAWRGDTLVHDDAFALSAYGPVYFAADYKSVTRLEFSTAHYWQAVADDLKFVTTGSRQ
ncbi:hypothetical protein [Pelagibacterium halotolerans]|uniref:hypothetical protein n=1 Tax=Pelagibacterium halotolerans TaxID=531813 RepID=UPI001115098B|nr:hypothetical protein [Pelagibacterium halotolerans]QJR18822.1 hypothetical protein HKM20_10430 [Pelagibacterium halotolerans]